MTAEVNTRAVVTAHCPRRWGAASAALVVRDEDTGASAEYPARWRGLAGGSEEWYGVYTPAHAGLYWCSFRFETPDGVRRTPERQLTAYAAQPLSWLADAVVYQIFPDRFARTVKRALPPGRDGYVHENWDDTPDFLPDAEGEIRNSDFFGGDLDGAAERLPYLKSLGFNTIYLNPIFESDSNHRYDVCDYEHVDALLGGDEAFARFAAACRESGFRLLLDGVFSHNGAGSRYFNMYGRYAGGAYRDKDSPYYKWYEFRRWPDEYSCWWGIKTLPQVRETEPSYLNYICGEDGIVRRWLRAGADGWRLDVADELPDEFVAAVYKAARAEKPDSAVIGEVWEDASNKISYGVRRRYLLGGELDGVMNYPFRNAIIEYARGGGAAALGETIETLTENYPPSALLCSLSFLGTHDTERALTLLSGAARPETREARAKHFLTAEELFTAAERLRLAAAILYALPGAPCVYYGDEAGAQGWEDPFNRRGYPWGRELPGLTDWFARLGKLRRELTPLRRGTTEVLEAADSVLVLRRRCGGESVTAAFNTGGAAYSRALGRTLERGLTAYWDDKGRNWLTGGFI